MSSDFTLISEIILNNYTAKIYRFSTATSYVDQQTIDSLLPVLTNKTQSSQIVEDLQVLLGVSKVEVFDKITGLLVGSSVASE